MLQALSLDVDVEPGSSARCHCGNICMPDAIYCRKCGRRRSDETLDKMIDFMLRVEVFDGIPREELPKLAAAFSTKTFQAGEAIVTQGEMGHEIFFIQEGSVSVKVREGANRSEIQVAMLHHGQYFGEASLLTCAPRNASVYAHEEGVVVKVLSKEQFEELGLRSKLDLEVKYAKLSSGLSGLASSLGSLRSFAKLLLALGLYMTLSILMFRHWEDWDVTSCVYFSSVTLLTIGYGDLSPTHTFSKLVVVIFVITADVVIAVIIGGLLESLVTTEIKNEKARKALLLHQARVGVFDRSGQRQRFYWKLCRCVAAILGLIVVYVIAAILFVADVEDFTDALYFAVITLSTIGYGDITIDDDEGKWVVSILSLFGVPLFAILLGKIADIAYGRARNEHIYTVVGGLTVEKYEHLVEFTDEMAKAGAYNSKPRESRRHEITPFEFMCFVLVKNETISLDEIKSIMSNFSELDVNRSGFIDQADLDEWQRRGATNPVGLMASKASGKRERSRSPPCQTHGSRQTANASPLLTGCA